VDWNIVLEQINSAFDQMTEAAQESDPWQRRAALDEFQKDFDQLIGGTRESITSFGIVWKALRQKPRSELVGSVITSLMVPAVGAAQKAEDRSAIQRELTRLALWLSVYHGQYGEYPESLEALVPQYIDQVPLDTFSPLRRPVVYLRQPEGYLLYSVGPNTVDDGGTDNPVEGDIVIRVIRPQAETSPSASGE
jgi:hypothetical protein